MRLLFFKTLLIYTAFAFINIFGWSGLLRFAGQQFIRFGYPRRLGHLAFPHGERIRFFTLRIGRHGLHRIC